MGRATGPNGRVPPEKWEVYFQALSRGAPRYSAAAEAGINVKTADRLHNEPTKSSGVEHYKRWLSHNVTDVVPYSRMSPNARRAFRDFGYFRERYFGHISRPWHVEAANEMLKLLETPQKEYVVVNCPPGSGKSTMFTHDLVCWVIVRNRAIRCMIGTGAETTGVDYTMRIKSSMERTLPEEADENDQALGLATNAKACLIADYGRFRPDGVGYWRADKLVVAREGGVPAHQKEASVVSYGRKSQFLGGRFNFVIWDDVVTDQNARSQLHQDELARWWRNTAESRLEPGGLLILQGQRLGPSDLYRYALDLRDIAAGFDGNYDDADMDPERLPRKYHHIVYKAHYEDRCKGSGNGKHHAVTAAPWPKGCLLDPQRLTYRDLRIAQYNDPKNYATVYQQEDTDPTTVLVNPMWINGGSDPKTGALFPGCWDKDRQLGAFPQNLAGDVYSVITADPSPSAFWAVMWWAWQVDTQFQHLINMERKRMGANDLLDYRISTGTYSGLLEDWWQRSKDIGRPISHVILETNAAQRFLLQYDYARQWSMTRSVELVPHNTGRNKSDPDLGVGALAPHYRFGRVRLPGHPLTRPNVLQLYNEVTRYPDVGTTDCVMAHWFLVWNAAQLFTPRQVTAPTFKRPTWIRDARRGVA